ncbi:hypothetical protein D3C78_925980 [compost metagenome]
MIFAAFAQYPDHIDLGSALQHLLLLAVFHFDNHQRAAIGCQAFEASGNGGQGGFVADQQIAVEHVRHDHRTPWPADVQELPRFGLFGPGRGRAVAVQYEVDVQFQGVQIVATRGVVAHLRQRTIVLAGAQHQGFQCRGLFGILREQQFDVVVRAEADKTCQFRATQGNPAHAWSQVDHAQHFQATAFDFVHDTVNG